MTTHGRPGPATVTIDRITKRFGSVTAVDGANLHIEAGTLVCLLGPSGCGKSTTLRIVGGFEEPTAGRILIGADDVTGAPPYDRPTAMVFQSYALFPHMSVFDNVAYGLRARRWSKGEVIAATRAAIELMELGAHATRSPAQLSGGQQQRVALARAIVTRPTVLLFDEPLSSLDAQMRVRVRSEIRALQQRLGTTTLYVTHDQEEAFTIADLVAVMNGGRIVQVGTPQQLYQEPVDRFVAEFVGTSNVLAATVLGQTPEGLDLDVLGRVVRARRGAVAPGGTAVIVLRPESVRISAPAGDRVAARILGATFIGPLIRYVVGVEAHGAELIVDLHDPGAEDFHGIGTLVGLDLPREIPTTLG